MSTERKSKRKRNAAVAGALLVVFFCWLAVTYRIEWRLQDLDSGYGEEAHRNRFLAAELVLRGWGHEVESVSGLGLLDALPQVSDLVVLAANRRTLSQRRRIYLRQWVKTGGNLVVIASELYDEEAGASRDKLLDEHGIYLLEPEEEESDEEGEESDLADEDGEGEVEREADKLRDEVREFVEGITDNKLSACMDEGLSHINIGDYAETIRLEFGGNHYLTCPDEETGCSWGDNGTQLVYLPLGEGSITAVTSLSFLSNQRIHCFDHALLLGFLANRANKTWLLYDPELPALSKWILARFPMASVSFLLLLSCWGASRSLRFGPDLPTLDIGRRELLEHLEASTHFSWRRGQLQGALDEVRSDLLERASLHHGGKRALNAQEVAQLFAPLTHQSESDIYSAMTDPAPVRRREFIRTVKTLQTIRSVL